MNKLLFISTSICIIWNFPYLFFSQQKTFVKSVYMIKHFTSILNHSSNNYMFILVDNSVQALCAGVDLTHVNELEELYLLMVYIMIYIYSIITNQVFYCILSKVISTRLHNNFLTN